MRGLKRNRQKYIQIFTGPVLAYRFTEAVSKKNLTVKQTDIIFLDLLSVHPWLSLH